MEHELFKIWLESNEKEFEKYEEELKAYNQVPDLVARSADKYILQALELFKNKEVAKPATTFYNVIKDVYIQIGNQSPFLVIIMQRMAENMDLLAKFRENSFDQDIRGELRRRGFV